MNHRIHAELGDQVREEEGVLAPGETLRLGQGSCRDMATLFVESCRRLGIAARFVSGYVHGPATEAGGAATHAWAEVYLPGAGWKGFDPHTRRRRRSRPHSGRRAPPPGARAAGGGDCFIGPNGLRPSLTVDVQINALDPD